MEERGREEERKRENPEDVLLVASQKGNREGRVNAYSPRHPNPVIRATFSHSPVTYQRPTEFIRNIPRIVNVNQRETVRAVFYP